MPLIFPLLFQCFMFKDQNMAEKQTKLTKNLKKGLCRIFPCCWHYQQLGYDIFWGFRLMVLEERAELILSYFYMHQSYLAMHMLLIQICLYSKSDINRVTSTEWYQQIELNSVTSIDWYQQSEINRTLLKCEIKSVLLCSYISVCV